MKYKNTAFRKHLNKSLQFFRSLGNCFDHNTLLVLTQIHKMLCSTWFCLFFGYTLENLLHFQTGLSNLIQS